MNAEGDLQNLHSQVGIDILQPFGVLVVGNDMQMESGEDEATRSNMTDAMEYDEDFEELVTSSIDLVANSHCQQQENVQRAIA